ncbi:MAG TPA: glycosyltransferase family 2 protein [Caulobacteraceae bacterium]
MNSPVEISCVIPAFEAVDLTARCLTSALAQRSVEFEIIVTDDSATGEIRALVEALTPRVANIRYIEGPRSGNPVDNWNHGLGQACGAACVLVHQDEFIVDPLYFRRAVDRLTMTNAAAVVGQTRVIGVTRPSRFGLVAALARAVGRPRWLLPIANWLGPTAAFVFRRGPLFDPSLVAIVDVAFYRTVLKTGPLEVLEGVCVGSLGHHGAQISAGLDFRAVVARELRDLARRSPPAIGPAEYAVVSAWLRLRSWLG